MLPAGVIAVLCIVFIVGCIIAGLAFSKWLKKDQELSRKRRASKERERSRAHLRKNVAPPTHAASPDVSNTDSTPI